MDALATFLLQVDPVTVQAEAFVGKAHRAVIAEVAARARKPSPPIPINLKEIHGWRERHPGSIRPHSTPAPVVVLPPRFTETQLRIATAALDTIERKAH